MGEPIGENCSASVVEIDSMRVAAEIMLPGRPRWAVYDSASDVIYANVAVGDPGTVTVIDTAALALVETVATERDAHTLAYDPDGETLYVLCPRSCGVAVYADAEDAGG